MYVRNATHNESMIKKDEKSEVIKEQSTKEEMLWTQ